MALYLFLLIVIVAGIALTFTLRGAALKRALKFYLGGFLLSLGGCLGSLAWLDAETSGRSSLVTPINPYLFAACFVAGVIILTYNSVRIIRDWRSRRSSDADESRPADEESGN